MPGRIRSVSWAAQMTAPRSLKTLTRSLAWMFRASGVFGIDPHDPVIVAVDQDPVVLDVVDPALLAVAHGVEAVAGMGCNELQADTCRRAPSYGALPRRGCIWS